MNETMSNILEFHWLLGNIDAKHGQWELVDLHKKYQCNFFSLNFFKFNIAFRNIGEQKIM